MRDTDHSGRPPRPAAGIYRRWGKRWLDLALTLPALVLLTPLAAAVALAVAATLGRPVLFRQVRPGRGGEPFAILKFRTMTQVHDERGIPLSDQARLTPFGRFLRSTSLDELPELINVLRGEMSLVGPRPLLLHYRDHYTPYQARRHEVMPGITGWAQVNGRNAVEWNDRLALDVWYVDHRTFWLDMRILALTARKVLAREGISAAGHATMPEFTGSNTNELAPSSSAGGRGGVAAPAERPPSRPK